MISDNTSIILYMYIIIACCNNNDSNNDIRIIIISIFTFRSVGNNNTCYHSNVITTCSSCMHNIIR